MTDNLLGEPDGALVLPLVPSVFALSPPDGRLIEPELLRRGGAGPRRPTIRGGNA
jgi:hypothetical protein